MAPREGYIYTLSDPETGAVRYVGQTVNPKGREWQHCSASNNRAGRRVNVWIRGLLKSRRTPALRVVERCDDMDAREIHWIAEYQAMGADLLNMNEGGTPTDFLNKAPKSHVLRGERDALHAVRSSWRRDITSAQREGNDASARRLQQKLERFERTVKFICGRLGQEIGLSVINAKFADEVR